MPHVKLNQRFVDTIRADVEKKKQEWFDIDIKGFYLEVRNSGGKSYRMRLRDRVGGLSVINLGDAACVQFSEAREQARSLRAQAQLGEWRADQAKRAVAASLCLQDFVTAHYLPYVSERKRSVATDISVLNNHLLPAFGQCRIDQISKVSVVEFHSAKRHGGYAPGTVDRMVVLLRFMLNLAVKWGLMPANCHPVKDFDFFNVPNGRERFLKPDELERLVTALKSSENKDLYNIVHGLLLTGCRRGELLNAKWKDVDFDRGLWVIPLTKQGKPHQLPISAELRAYFLGLPSREVSEFLFPSPLTGRPYKSVFYSWDRARKQAGMPELRIHDLRHSFASFLVNGGRSLYEVQRLLGHSTPRTTQRYAHLSLGALTDAMSVAEAAMGPFAVAEQ
jgi:integrase